MTFNSSLSSVFNFKCVSELDAVSNAQADSQIREFKYYVKITNGQEKKEREWRCRVCSTVSVLHIKYNGIIIIYIQNIEVV